MYESLLRSYGARTLLRAVGL